ncbi:MAG TPA: histidinol-phosphate transaminase [Phycisphaerales bacterium]
MSTATPTPGAPTLSPYSTPTTGAAIDLFLDANEGPGGCVDVARLAALLPSDATRRYAGPIVLEQQLGAVLGLNPARVLVTAGGDEAIDRTCRTFLTPGRELILPTPTFEMIGRYAQQAGATVAPTPWNPGPYPVDRVLELVNPRTAMIAVVSPNNPTGSVASASDLRRLAEAAPNAVLLVDLAYTEFADEDLTRAALELPNAVVIRTFSKAYGLAGLRVGYALGSENVIGSLRAHGSPFPVSTLSLAVAAEALRRSADYLPGVVSRVRAERSELGVLLRELGANPLPSQGNFILAEFADADWVWRALASLGIGVRRYKPGVGLDRALRITCPGDATSLTRLTHGLQQAMRPGTIVVATDDLDAPLWNDANTTALRRLAARLPVVLVTRVARDRCERELRDRGLEGVCAGVIAAEGLDDRATAEALTGTLTRLQAAPGWMVSTSPDFLPAPSAASRLIPLGWVAPGTLGGQGAEQLRRAGAARVVDSLLSLEDLLS